MATIAVLSPSVGAAKAVPRMAVVAAVAMVDSSEISTSHGCCCCRSTASDLVLLLS